MDFAGQILQSVLNKNKDALRIEGSEDISINVKTQRNDYPLAAFDDQGINKILLVDYKDNIRQVRVDRC